MANPGPTLVDDLKSAVRPAQPPNAERNQVPMFIGELGRSTRSMLRNRAGRPRSAMSRAALATAPHADTRLQRRDSSDIPRPPSTSADAARPAVEHVLLPLVAGDELESGCSLGAEAALRDRRVGIPSMSMIFTFRRTSMTGGPPVGRQWAKTR
jgi:hypothetical protein